MKEIKEEFDKLNQEHHKLIQVFKQQEKELEGAKTIIKKQEEGL